MAMLQGNIRWAKILGAPVPAYTKGEFEWSFDVEVDEATRAKLEEDGAGFYVKDKEDREPFVTFRRKSVKKDGDPAQPFRVVDSKGVDWDRKIPIGNGSRVNVKYLYNEVGEGKNKRQKPSALAIQIVRLEEYEGDKGFPIYDEAGNEEVWSTTED